MTDSLNEKAFEYATVGLNAEHKDVAKHAIRQYLRQHNAAALPTDILKRVTEAIKHAPVERQVVRQELRQGIDDNRPVMVREEVRFVVTDESRAKAAIDAIQLHVADKNVADNKREISLPDGYTNWQEVLDENASYERLMGKLMDEQNSLKAQLSQTETSVSDEELKEIIITAMTDYEQDVYNNKTSGTQIYVEGEAERIVKALLPYLKREIGLDKEVLIELMNAYNFSHSSNNYYSKRAEEIIIENGGFVVENKVKRNSIEDGSANG